MAQSTAWATEAFATNLQGRCFLILHCLQPPLLLHANVTADVVNGQGVVHATSARCLLGGSAAKGSMCKVFHERHVQDAQ
jgi:hypothetical protein